MFKDYINAVINDYHDKVASNTISLNLSPLTPGNVKKECKAVCKERFRTADQRMLNAVFGNADNADKYLKAIERYDIDKFRPMINFVEGRSKETDSKNVELLAWLIDFEDRPYDANGKYGGVNQSSQLGEPHIGTEESPSLTSAQPPLTQEKGLVVKSEKPRSRKKILVTALIVSLFAGTVGYFNLNKPSGDSCMYWKEDHYERISCNQKVQYSKVIALDQDLLNNFRKIANSRTITYSSIGKVWYIKINGEPEFYTSMGYHPIFMQLQLKPITKYIIDSHIHKKTLSNDSIPK